MRLILIALVVVAGSVSCTSLSTFEAEIAKGQAALIPAENLACEAATDLDPSGATALCTEIDTAGNAVGLGITVVEDAASIAALLKQAFGKTDSAKAALAQFHSAKFHAKVVH